MTATRPPDVIHLGPRGAAPDQRADPPSSLTPDQRRRLAVALARLLRAAVTPPDAIPEAQRPAQLPPLRSSRRPPSRAA